MRKFWNWLKTSDLAAFIIITLATFTIIFFPYGSIHSLTWGNHTIHVHEYNLLGDYIGGITAPVAIILLFLTYRSQKQELNETRRAMKSQQASTTLFSMINVLNNTIGTISDIKEVEVFDAFTTLGSEKEPLIRQEPIQGREVMFHHADKIRELSFTPNIHYDYNMETFAFDEITLNLKSGFLDGTLAIGDVREAVERTPTGKSITVDDYIKLIRPLLREYFQHERNALMNVLHYVESISDFIQHEFDSDQQKIFYGRTFAAQFSSEELLVIFYYSLSDLSSRPMLNQVLTKMEFFDNISETDWTHKEHKAIYRHRAFLADTFPWRFVN